MEALSNLYLPGALAVWCALIFAVASLIGYASAVSNRAAGPAALAAADSSRAFARRSYSFFVFSVLMSALVLGMALLRRDFRIEYVFQYSGLDLPAHYQFASFWAGQKGSFLIWLVWGAILGVPLARAARRDEAPVMAVYVATLLGLLFILVRENPFVMLSEAPLDGKGLNPLLQDNWMVIHPPIMFVGYAASAIPFAFAISAMWRRDYSDWARRAFPWALGGFLVLGTAILMGGYWAYKTLGWGGYWGWDPVENASLIPWLFGTALIHGLYVERTRGRFRRANLVIACLLYMSVLYGTFLTRSGVLADFSVHSFVDLGISGWLIGLLAVFGGLSLYLLATRLKGVPKPRTTDSSMLSRGAFVMLSMITVLLTATIVTVGTSAPLLTRFLENPGQVGPSFYNRMNFPLALLIALLLSIIPYLTWREELLSVGDADETEAAPTAAKKGPAFADLPQLLRRMIPALVLATLATIVGAVAAIRDPFHLAFLFLATLAVGTNLHKVINNGRKAGWAGVTASGGYLAHVGVGTILIGILASSAYDQSAKVTLTAGEPQAVGDVTVTFQRFVPRGELPARCGNKECMEVKVVHANGKSFLSYPKLFMNQRSRQMMVNPDIEKSWLADLYISPIEFDPGSRAGQARTVRLAKDETIEIDGAQVKFLGFDLNGDGNVQAQLANGQQVVVGAGVEIQNGDSRNVVVPTYRFNAAGFIDTPPESLPGGGQIVLAGLNPTDGSVTLAMTSNTPVPATLAIDVTKKPLINLVWWGLYVVGIGGGLSTIKRFREARSA
jgi:cytochrome c-type biogenesis protein CcmF